jgi:hypothetical protein
VSALLIGSNGSAIILPEEGIEKKKKLSCWRSYKKEE